MAPPIVNRCDTMFIEKLQQIVRIMHALFTINSCRNTEYRFLKPKQVDCLLHLKESDVIACLKTSFGKSLIFESLAHLHLRSSVLIINPLNSIITEQLDRYGSMAICVSPELLQRLQKHSCSTMSLDCDLCKFVSAKFKFVIGHPEHFLNKVIIDIFSNAAWQETSTSIVIDEAHCVEKWGADFRKDYKKLSMLRSTFPNAKVLALTGTATKQTCEAIKKTLHLKNLKIISTAIVRDNIKLTCKKRPVQNSTDSHGSVLMPIIKELKEKQDRFPKTVIYSKLKWCAAGYQLAMLPENDGTPVDETMKTFVSQYHAPSTEELKQHVVQQMSSDSLRLLFATEAYSMGTDAPDIRRIIHFGVPNSLENIQIVRNGINWIEARNECFKKGGMMSNEDEFGTCNNKTKETNTWIEPHHILSPWLGKKGCFDLRNASTSKQRTRSVQECYSLCDKTYFGYINAFCICIWTIDIAPIPNSNCLIDNLYQNTIAWVYVANELNISNVDDFRSGNCVGTRCTNMSSDLEVSNCYSGKKSLCQTGTHSRPLDTYSWETAENFCNINNADFSVTNLKDICKHIDFAEHDLNLYWTGYKRYWYKSTSNMSTESIQSLSEVFNCSYMECLNNAATAIRKQGNCSQKLNGYACLTNMVPEATSKEESTISNHFTIETKNQTTREPNTDTSNNQHSGHVTSNQIVSSRESGTTIMNIATSGTSEKRQGPFKRTKQEPGSQMTEMHDPNYHDFETAPHNAPSMLQSNTAYNTHTSGSHQTSESIQSGTASKNE